MNYGKVFSAAINVVAATGDLSLLGHVGVIGSAVINDPTLLNKATLTDTSKLEQIAQAGEIDEVVDAAYAIVKSCTTLLKDPHQAPKVTALIGALTS